MTSDEKERMTELCKQIEIEKDPQTFDALVKELNDLRDLKHGRVHLEYKR